MRAVQTGPVIGLAATLALLAALDAAARGGLARFGGAGLSAAGWVSGAVCGLALAIFLKRGLSRAGSARLGPADRVTLTRAVLVCGVTALITSAAVPGPLGSTVPATALAGLAAVALVLDAVDGWVARRTRTESPLGARFDMEVDAFLILVLSVYDAGRVGVWVLAIGLARYGFVAAGRALPWMRRPLPPRYWRKVVAATAGVALAFAAAGVGPHAVAAGALAGTLALLAESFGRDVWWLWRTRTRRAGQLQLPIVVTTAPPSAARSQPPVAVPRVLTSVERRSDG